MTVEALSMRFCHVSLSNNLCGIVSKTERT